MAVISKQMIKRFYDMPAQRSIFYGCSTGGQQALREAQDFPADFNGIIAGAPANNRTHLHSMFVWNYHATRAAGDDSILPSSTFGICTPAGGRRLQSFRYGRAERHIPYGCARLPFRLRFARCV
jgi:feruloyl esterase